MNDNLPAVRQASTVTIPQNPDSWISVVENIADFANQICDTDFVPKSLRGKPAAVAAAILSGREIGLPPMTALQGTHVIEGRPGLSAEMMRALVLSAGHEIEIMESTGAVCTMRGRRAGRDNWTTVTWTTDMARAANLINKSNWKSYPRAQLQARSTTELCRLIFPDVIHGFRSVEELEDMGDVDETQSGGTDAGASEGTAPVKRSGRRTAKAAAAALPAAAAEPRSGTEVPLPGEPGYDDLTGTSGEAAQAEPLVEERIGDDEPAASPEPDVSGAGVDATPDPAPETQTGAGEAGLRGTDEPSPAPADVDGAEAQSGPAEAGAAPSADTEGEKIPPRQRTPAQHRMMQARFADLLGEGVERDERIRITSIIIGRDISSSNELSVDDAKAVIDTLGRVETVGDLYAILDAITDQRS